MRAFFMILLLSSLVPAAAGQLQFESSIPISSPLAYTQSSSGLGYPAWESGRTELEMGDLNGDGYVDIVSIGDHGCPYVGTQEHGLMVWFGNGTGAGWSVYMKGDFGYGGVALGDVNNDGLMDVGYGMHHAYSGNDLGDQLIEVALGDGTGMNWTPWDDGLAGHGQSWGMFGTDFADVDSDGDLDLVSISFGSGDGLHVYLNNGDGTWTRSFGFLGGNSNMIVGFGDVNGDGNPDIAADHQSGAVWFGDGAGNFTNMDGNLPDPGSYSHYYGTDLGDLDGDGKQELSFCMSNGSVQVWRWTGGSRWASLSQGLPSTSKYRYTQLADMDGDGDLDLVTQGGDKVSIWSLKQGTWHEVHGFTTVSGSSSEAFRTGVDVDYNGRPDLVILNEEGSWPNEKNYLRFFRESSKPRWQRVRLTFPRGHERFHRGAVIFLDWLSAVPGGGGGATSVSLKLSTNGSAGPWTDIASGIPNSGRYQWRIPKSLPASTDCRIRIRMDAPAGSAFFTMKKAFTLD